MKKKPLKIGVIGLGRIGWDFHCPALVKHHDFVLAGVVDTLPERCAEAKARYGCPAFADYRELLEKVPLDAVVVASPTHLHLPMAVAALKQGIHVLLEKPMALDAKEAAAIERAARRYRRVLTVYQPHRMAAYFQHLKRLIDSGVIGKVYHIRRGLFSFSQRNDWQSLRRFGGGMLANFGAHGLDQVLQLAGCDIDRVFCRLGRVASLGDAEDVVKVVIQTRAGVLGEVDINQACVMPLYEFEVLGTTGAISLKGRELHVRSFLPAQLPTRQLEQGLASAGRQYPAGGPTCKDQVIPVDERYAVDVYADFARAIRNGTQPQVKPQESVSLIDLIDRCRRTSGDMVVTPIRDMRLKASRGSKT